MRNFLFLLLLAPGLAFAAASVDTLKGFLNNTTTARARFAQTVIDKNNKPLQSSSGTMEFSRPEVADILIQWAQSAK